MGMLIVIIPYRHSWVQGMLTHIEGIIQWAGCFRTQAGKSQSLHTGLPHVSIDAQTDGTSASHTKPKALIDFRYSTECLAAFIPGITSLNKCSARALLLCIACSQLRVTAIRGVHLGTRHQVGEIVVELNEGPLPELFVVPASM